MVTLYGLFNCISKCLNRAEIPCCYFFKERKLFFSSLKDGIYGQLFFKSHQIGCQTDGQMRKEPINLLRF